MDRPVTKDYLKMPSPYKTLALLFLIGTGRLLAEATDLSLDDAISAALSNNLGLRIASIEPANALDSIEIEEAGFDPSFFGSTSYQERRSAARNSALDDFVIPQSDSRRARVGAEKPFSTGANVTLGSSLSRSTSNNNAARNPDYASDLGVSIRQPLLRGAGPTINLAPLARAKVNAERSLFELRSDVLDLVLETEIAYWNLAFARADRALIASSLELAQNLLEENRERERLGLVTRLEVLQAEAEILNQQEAIIQADRVIEDAQDTLRRAMGQADFSASITDSFAVKELPETIGELRSMETVVLETLMNDDDARAQERRMEVNRINRMLAQDQIQPDLNLTAGVDYLGRDTSGRVAQRGALKGDGYDWNVGLEVRLPWGFREARARERQAARNLEQAELRLYDIKQQKALAARNAWRAANAGLKRIEVTRAAMALNEESFEQERARFSSGLVAYRNVLEAQRDLDRARSNYLRSVIETLRASVRLSRVDGSLLERNGLNWDAVGPYINSSNTRSENTLSLVDKY
ncbi:MAG: TolC family protein [Puniceicoccaceae bacterium]|nr:MAG: TolC family protein [Puniceicoccaceae bacterium]